MSQTPAIHEISIPPDAPPPGRLDACLAARLETLSRSRLRTLIEEGHVTVNGARAKPRHAIRPGDHIRVEVPPDAPAETTAEDIPLQVVYEDEALAVIHKPTGMVVHPAAGNPSGTLVNALLHRFGSLSSVGGVARPGIVHRLDKETSGLMVVALQDAAHHALAEAFAERHIHKLYLAVAAGRPARSHVAIRTRIGRHPVDRKRMAVLDPPHGREAATDCTLVHHSGGGLAKGASLVVCRLHTGRTHQIRVHLHHLGHPILGDPVYSRPPVRHAAPRLLLHAWHLAFAHPLSSAPLAFTAPPGQAFAPWLPDDGLPPPHDFI